jgi:hypothetical protein
VAGICIDQGEPSGAQRLGDWSSGMIPASGAGGREFDSRITPLFARTGVGGHAWCLDCMVFLLLYKEHLIISRKTNRSILKNLKTVHVTVHVHVKDR